MFRLKQDQLEKLEKLFGDQAVLKRAKVFCKFEAILHA